MTSPATITRCNVINISEHDIDKKDFIDKELPLMSNKEIRKRLALLMGEFAITEIRRLIKLARVVFFRVVEDGGSLWTSRFYVFCLPLKKCKQPID